MPVRRILLVGGGHAHLEVLRRFAQKPDAGIELALANPTRALPVFGDAAGIDRRPSGHRRVAGRPSRACAMGRARASSATAPSRSISTRGSSALPKAASSRSICCRSTSAPSPDLSVPGVREHALPLCPTDRFLAGWSRLEADATAGDVRTIAVVGSGADGGRDAAGDAISADADRRRERASLCAHHRGAARAPRAYSRHAQAHRQDPGRARHRALHGQRGQRSRAGRRRHDDGPAHRRRPRRVGDAGGGRAVARRVEPRVRSARLRPRQRIAAVGVRSLCVCGRRLRDAGRRTPRRGPARLPPARACRSPRTCVMPPITNRSSSRVHGGVGGPSSRRDRATQSRRGGPSFPMASMSGAGRTGSIARTSPVTILRRRKRRNRPRRSRMRWNTIRTLPRIP